MAEAGGVRFNASRVVPRIHRSTMIRVFHYFRDTRDIIANYSERWCGNVSRFARREQHADDKQERKITRSPIKYPAERLLNCAIDGTADNCSGIISHPAILHGKITPNLASSPLSLSLCSREACVSPRRTGGSQRGEREGSLLCFDVVDLDSRLRLNCLRLKLLCELHASALIRDLRR